MILISVTTIYNKSRHIENEKRIFIVCEGHWEKHLQKELWKRGVWHLPVAVANECKVASDMSEKIGIRYKDRLTFWHSTKCKDILDWKWNGF